MLPVSVSQQILNATTGEFALIYHSRSAYARSPSDNDQTNQAVRLSGEP